jgi:hypothetical protein
MKAIHKFLLILTIALFAQCNPKYISRYQAKRIALDTLDKTNTVVKRVSVDLKNDTIWVVSTSSFKKPNSGFGGITKVMINARDGKVLKIGHLK